MMKNRHDPFSLLVVVLLSSFSTMPLFQPFFFASSDGLFHLYRLMEYDVVLRGGLLYPRWAPDFFFGYGFPLFNYYAPLTYYFGELFRLLGAGYIDSLKLLVALGMLLSGVGAFIYARRFLSPVSSILAAIVYMYVPYHIVNLYYRGDIPEYLAYTLFPFILWALGKTVETRRAKHVVAASILCAALILTHNLSAFIFSGFLIVYSLALLAQKWAFTPAQSAKKGTAPASTFSGQVAPLPSSSLKVTAFSVWRGIGADVLSLAVVACLAAGLSAFFWIPALAEKSLVNFDLLLVHYNFREHFPSFEDLLSTSLIHKYGVVFSSAEVFGYKLGAFQALFLLLGVVVTVLRWRHLNVRLRVEALASIVVAAIAFFFIFPVSIWVWENTPFLNLTQFPWRFLAFLGLPTALLAGVFVDALPAQLWDRGRQIVKSPRHASSPDRTDIVAWAEPSSLCYVSLRRMVAVALIAIVIVSSTVALSPILSDVREDDISPAGSLQFELTYGAIGTSAAAEYLPKWVKERPATSPMALAYVLNQDNPPALARTTTSVDAKILEKRPNVTTYQLSGTGGEIVLNSLYFPGWQAWLNGAKVEIGIDDPTGLIKIAVPGGEHHLRLEFVETRLRLFADAISAIALVGVLALLLWSAVLSRRPGEPVLNAKERNKQCNGHSLRGRMVSREAMAKLGVVGVIVLIWLGAKWAYDGAYGPPLSQGLPLLVNLNNQVVLEGYELSGATTARGLTARTSAGATVQVGLYWRLLNQSSSAADYVPFARLTNSFNQTWAYAESSGESLVDSPGGKTLATVLPLAIPDATPPGVYQIEVGMHTRSIGKPLDVARVHVVPVLPAERGARIGPVVVEKGTSQVVTGLSPSAEKTPKEPVNFQGSLRLLEFRVADGEALRSGKPGKPFAVGPEAKTWALRGGETVHLDLLWQATRRIDENLAVTARLTGEGGTLWAVRDSQPVDGTYPTRYWDKDERVRDQLNLRIPPETPPGQYTLELEVIGHSGPLSIIDPEGTPIGPTFKLGSVSLSPPGSPPHLADLKVRRSLMKPLSDAITLVGYELGRPEAQPGERVRLELFWLATARPLDDLRLRVELLDRAGKSWPLVAIRPVGDDYPTSRWKGGDIWRGQYDLVLPAALGEGDGRLVAFLDDTDTARVVAEAQVGELRILPRSRTFSATPGNPLLREFDGKVRLLGFDVTVGQEKFVGKLPIVAPGQTLGVTVFWQAASEMRINYTVFAQIVNSAGKLVAQHDSVPGLGQSPTTSWLLDEVVEDTHPIGIPDALPAGDYTVIAGLYDAISGKRLATGSGEDYVRLTPLKIER